MHGPNVQCRATGQHLLSLAAVDSSWGACLGTQLRSNCCNTLHSLGKLRRRCAAHVSAALLPAHCQCLTGCRGGLLLVGSTIVWQCLGSIAQVVIKERGTERPRGFGFVTFKSEEDAQSVCGVEHCLNNRKARVVARRLRGCTVHAFCAACGLTCQCGGTSSECCYAIAAHSCLGSWAALGRPGPCWVGARRCPHWQAADALHTCCAG